MKKNGEKMKRIFVVFVALLCASLAYGQITTTKVAPKTEQVDNTPYDSTQNFLGKDVYKYIGQELYLKGEVKSLREYSYKHFLLDYTKEGFINKENIYKCTDNYTSNYDELAGKYFKVLNVIKHPKVEDNEYLYGKIFFLKLKEKSSGDIIYYEYWCDLDASFPFIVVGFFQKQKKYLVGKEFIISEGLLKNLCDIETGNPITTKGQIWRCIDLTINEKYYSLSLVIQNSLSEKVTISYDSVIGKWGKPRAYTLIEASNYRKKFGNENFDRILQRKVRIGMSKEMCRLSWGNPENINETITSGEKIEQWIYPENYLYFNNGILTAIQQE